MRTAAVRGSVCFLTHISPPPPPSSRSPLPRITTKNLHKAPPIRSLRHFTPLFASPLPSRLSSSSSSSSSTVSMSSATGEALSSSTSPSPSPSPSPMERQFEEIRTQLEESGALRDRIREVVAEMEYAVRLMHFNALLVHDHSLPVAQVVEKASVQVGVLKEQFKRLAEILRECPGQYYRYNGDWKSETQSAVSLVAFLHWLETGSLLLHQEAQEKLGLNSSEFGLDLEDYLIGLCFMSNDMPRYVVNQVTAGDYDCPKRVLRFLTDLHASFRMLNLRNDFLRKKFDSLKYDLRKVEEVFYDVKIRGLAPSDPEQENKPMLPTGLAAE